MSVATRLRRLLEVNGHSYAQAEKVTGVSRETIRRMVNGQQPPRMAIYLRRIATGYGIGELTLLEGATPKGEFEWHVHHASPAQRLEWLMMSQADRVKLTLDFLRVRYPQSVAVLPLAAAAGMPETRLRALLEGWEFSTPDRQVAGDLARAVHGLTGISLAWFQWGGLSEAWQEGINNLPRLSRWVQGPGLTKSLMVLIRERWS